MSTKPFSEFTLAEWAEHMRVIVQRDGHDVRAGRDNTIEAQSINTGEWLFLNLPHGKPVFPSTAERDAALARIKTP